MAAATAATTASARTAGTRHSSNLHVRFVRDVGELQKFNHKPFPAGRETIQQKEVFSEIFWNKKHFVLFAFLLFGGKVVSC
jgi:hypothetical protein